MLLCAAGDIHGAIVRLYDDVLAFETTLGIRFDWVLHVGDFGVWPDEVSVDRATRAHDGAGDFPAWLASGRGVPRRTVFIKGIHESVEWLGTRERSEILPGLFYRRNGQTMELDTEKGQAVRVGGIGGCYGPSDYEHRSDRLQGYARRHYTRDEIDRLAAAKRADIILTHDAPAGVDFPSRGRRASYVSPAAGLDTLLERVRPRVCFFGHHHTRVDADVAGVRCIGLNKIGYAGNLVAIDTTETKRAWAPFAEWPRQNST